METCHSCQHCAGTKHPTALPYCNVFKEPIWRHKNDCEYFSQISCRDEPTFREEHPEAYPEAAGAWK